MRRSEAGRVRRNGERGFTLIELLVVVTIIGILAAIVSVSVSGFTGTAQKNRKEANVASVQGAVDAWITLKTTGNVLSVPTGLTLTVTDATGWYDKSGNAAAMATAAGSNVYTEVNITTLVNEGLLRLRASTATFKCVFLPSSGSLNLGNNIGAFHTSNQVGACTD